MCCCTTILTTRVTIDYSGTTMSLYVECEMWMRIRDGRKPTIKYIHSCVIIYRKLYAYRIDIIMIFWRGACSLYTIFFCRSLSSIPLRRLLQKKNNIIKSKKERKRYMYSYIIIISLVSWKITEDWFCNVTLYLYICLFYLNITVTRTWSFFFYFNPPLQATRLLPSFIIKRTIIK